MEKFAALILAFCCLAVAAQAWECSSSPFGVATDYGLFSLGAVRSCESDTEGRVAAQGQVDLQSYSVGAALGTTSNSNLPYSLVSPSPINFNDGSVWAGGINGCPTAADNVAILIDQAAHWSNECCPASDCTVCDSTATFESPIDFVTAESCLQEVSDYWFSLAQTSGSSVEQSYQKLSLSCGNELTNVFTVSSLAGITEIAVVCPVTHTVLINYDGVDAVQNLGFVLEGGIAADKIIHHFNSPTLHVSGVEIPGTTFAPSTSVYFQQGLSSGSMIVGAFDAPVVDESYLLGEADGDECTRFGDGHAIWMSGIANDLVFTDENNFYTVNEDGTASLTGSATEGDITFDFSVTLSGYTETAPDGSPKEELQSSCYVANGGDVDPSTWIYYTDVTGTLTGAVGSLYEGAIVDITRRGPAAQVGDGANGKNVNNGLSFWFDWVVVQQGATHLRDGVGDFNLDVGAATSTPADCPRGQVNHVPFTGCIEVPDEPQCVYVDTCDCCE